MVIKMATKKRGPKPTENALTATQRKQKQRAKQSCLIKAAEDSGFNPYQVLISDRQIKSLARFIYLETKNIGMVDGQKINEVIYFALKNHLSNLEEDFIERGHSEETVEACSYSDDSSTDFNSLMGIEVAAEKYFKDWELKR